MANKTIKHKVKWYNIALPILTPAIALSIALPLTLTKRGGGDTPEPVVTEHTLTYEDCYSGGSTTYTTKVNDGERAIMHMPEHHDKCGFIGWKTVKDDADAPYFDFMNTKITSDMKFYGYWTYGESDKDMFEPYYDEQGIGPYVKINWDYSKGWPEYSKFDLVIPNELEVGGEKKAVIGVAPHAFASVNEWGEVEKALSIRSISLPDSIRVFSANSFTHCHNLRIVNMPKSLLTIGSRCFSYCYKISDLTLNDGLLYIGEYAFYNESSETFVKHLALPSSLKYIGSCAFVGNDSIETLDMSKCTDLEIEGASNGLGVFANCVALKNLYLPPNLKYIPSSCFFGCTNLRYVTIPKSVRYIESNAFCNCIRLRQVNIEEGSGLLWIDNCAFWSCNSLEKINFPASLQSMGEWAFADCYNLNNVTFEKTGEPWVYKLEESEEQFTPTNNGWENAKKIIECSNWSYMMAKPLEYKETVGTFTYNLKYLTDGSDRCVIVGGAPTEVGTINELRIPAKIGQYNVVGIASKAFVCDSTSEGTINQVSFETDTNANNYIEYIGGRAFKNQAKISIINLEACNNLKYIEAEAFCSAFEEVGPGYANLQINLKDLPIVNIGDGAFGVKDSTGWSPAYTSLKSVVLPETLTTLGSGAFYGQENLVTLDFTPCTSLTGFNYVFNYDGYRPRLYCEPIMKGTAVTSIDLSKTAIGFIPEGTFDTAEAMTTLSLPENLYDIGPLAFNGCKALKAVKIPASCQGIEWQAFNGCDALKTEGTDYGVTFDGTTSMWYLTNNEGTIVPWDAKAKTTKENAIALVNDKDATPPGYINYTWLKQTA